MHWADYSRLSATVCQKTPSQNHGTRMGAGIVTCIILISSVAKDGYLVIANESTYSSILWEAIHRGYVILGSQINDCIHLATSYLADTRSISSTIG